MLIDFIRQCGYIVSQDDIRPSCHISISIEFVRSSNSFILHYPGPDDFGQQSFSFDPQEFISAFSASQFKHSTPKADYLPFDSLFYMPNQRVSWAFSFFQINPTVIRQAFSQNKSVHRRIVLKPRKSKLLKAIGLYSRRQCINLPKEKKCSCIASNLREIERCNRNMQLAVSKAAASCDMNFFDTYLENYCALRTINHLSPHLSPRQYDKLLDSFSRMVVDLQSHSC